MVDLAIPDLPVHPAITDTDLGALDTGTQTRQFTWPQVKDYVLRNGGGGGIYLVVGNDAPSVLKRRADIVCDGTADQVDINAALAIGGVVMAGTFNISAGIVTVGPSPVLMGTGTGIDMGSGLGNRGFGTLLKQVSGFATGDVITVDQASISRPAGKANIRDFSIDGVDFGTGVNGVKFRSFQGKILNVDVQRMSGNGFFIYGYSTAVGDPVSWSTYDSNFSHLHSHGCAAAGIRFDTQGTDTHISDCTFEGNVNGIRVAGGASGQLDNVQCYENSDYNFWLDGAGSRWRLSNFKCEHAGKHGIFFDGTSGGTAGVQLDMCGFNCNGKSTHNTYSHIAMTGPSGATSVVMTNMEFGNSDGVSNLAKYCVDLGSNAANVIIDAVAGTSSLAGAGVGTAIFNIGNATVRSTTKITNVAGVHDMIGGTAPAIAMNAAAGTTPPAAVLTQATDRKGTVTFGTGTSIPGAPGTLLTFTYNVPHAFAGAVPTVIAGNSATQALGLYVTGDSTTGFSVNCATAPAASQANTVFKFYYHVFN